MGESVAPRPDPREVGIETLLSIARGEVQEENGMLPTVAEQIAAAEALVRNGATC